MMSAQSTLAERSVSPSVALVESASEKPFSKNFFDKENAVARATYFKVLILGTFAIIIVIFTVFSIYWGSLWKTPVRNLEGWVIDFDGGLVGQTVTQALSSAQAGHIGKVTWTPVSADRFRGPDELATEVKEQRTWVAIAIHSGSTERLQASYSNPNASYDGSEAITVYAAEARNENAYRNLIRPSAQAILDGITQTFAVQSISRLSSSPNLATLVKNSPQTLTKPIGYTLSNLLPFDKPVATAVTFVGLIYQLILSFFIVMTAHTAREESGLNRSLTLRSLILTRLVSSFGAYFFLSLFYALLSLAFQLDFSSKFGRSGFLVFWMLNWVGMLSVGLALESLVTLLTQRFIPFFMILWVIGNVSVCIFPIEVMPRIYHYGYAMPFYNVSRAVRTIVFGTKNHVGQNFGILIAWTFISCVTLPLIQWYVRRKEVTQTASSLPDDTPATANDEKAQV